MADKLDWLNKHLVLIRYLTVKDTVDGEHYRIPPDKEELFTGVNGAEEMVFRLAGKEDYKAACELLAYVAHRRAGVWWGYRCVLSLLEELKVNPAVDRDIAGIGANFEVTVPDWAKVELPKQDPAIQAPLKEALAENERNFKALEALLDPEVHSFAKEVVEIAFTEFKRVHGIHPIDLLKKAGARLNDDPYPLDLNSPVFKAEAELKVQLAAVQKETVETIKSVIPPKVPAREKKLRDNALSAVFRWVAAPDAENSQKCLDTGNECPDTPAGLLSLASFWAYGDLMPLGDQTVATPPGLAANGLNQVLLLCALHKGGTRKLKERYAEYFRLGIEALTGADNWEAALVTGKAPHEELPSAGTDSPPPDAASPLDLPAGYKRWKPEGRETRKNV